MTAAWDRVRAHVNAGAPASWDQSTLALAMLREHDLERGSWPLDEVWGDGEYGDWRYCQTCRAVMPYAAIQCPVCGQVYNERLEVIA